MPQTTNVPTTTCSYIDNWFSRQASHLHHFTAPRGLYPRHISHHPTHHGPWRAHPKGTARCLPAPHISSGGPPARPPIRRGYRATFVSSPNLLDTTSVAAGPRRSSSSAATASSSCTPATSAGGGHPLCTGPPPPRDPGSGPLDDDGPDAGRPEHLGPPDHIGGRNSPDVDWLEALEHPAAPPARPPWRPARSKLPLAEESPNNWVPEREPHNTVTRGSLPRPSEAHEHRKLQGRHPRPHHLPPVCLRLAGGGHRVGHGDCLEHPRPRVG